ncbi:hypothetical protein [Burkholderia stagnalis]|uniref:hypothetical protein n=1 Tax=Burkholderia stagnalis TaxID=1503054 RepID=UPI0013E0E459|nr:hypothetical protein [Burkholderia stagnalis]
MHHTFYRIMTITASAWQLTTLAETEAAEKWLLHESRAGASGIDSNGRVECQAVTG